MDATLTNSSSPATAAATADCGERPEPRALAEFLADYSAYLLGCGATTMRLEKNIGRMAQAWGCQADLFTLPRHIYLTLRCKQGHKPEIVNVAVPAVPINFAINTSLSNLSWKVADGKVSFHDAVALFHRITRVRPQNHTLLMFAVAAANASFCRLFGGDAVAMLIVAVATFCGYFIKLTMLRHHFDVRLVVLTCATVSSILAAGDFLFGISGTPELAVGTSILYLVPGIPFINSFSDLFNRHYICAFSRFLDAVVLTACLSLGLCIGMALMKISMF